MPPHADVGDLHDAKEPLRRAIAEWLNLRVAAGEMAPIPESLIEALVIGPIAEVS